MVIHIAGRLGSGKTLWCVGKMLDTFTFTDKLIVTNIRLKDYWDKLYADSRMEGMLSFVKFLISPLSSLSDFKRFLAESVASRYKYIPDIQEAINYCKTLGQGEEGSRLFMWDEIHLELNAREWKRTGKDMIEFFSMSRKRGFDIIMVSQLRSAVDRQCRDLSDISYELKNLRFLRPFGLPIFPKMGLLVKRWANRGLDEGKGVLLGGGLVRYNSFASTMYDTKQILSDKSIPEPALWSAGSLGSPCSRCAYMKYYIKYADFVTNFYERDYVSPLPHRLIAKDLGWMEIVDEDLSREAGRRPVASAGRSQAQQSSGGL